MVTERKDDVFAHVQQAHQSADTMYVTDMFTQRKASPQRQRGRHVVVIEQHLAGNRILHAENGLEETGAQQQDLAADYHAFARFDTETDVAEMDFFVIGRLSPSRGGFSWD